MIQGVVIQGIGSFYTVKTPQGELYTLRAKRKLRHQKVTPLIGDEILFSLGDSKEAHGWIEEILPRKNVCLRPPVANLSLLAIVVAPQPQPDFLLIDKLLIYALMQNLRVLLIVNKSDIDSKIFDVIQEQYKSANITCLSVSAVGKQGIEKLRTHLTGETTCFSGQSGVGKSTLLNELLGMEVQTGEISAKILRGKNTTRHSQMYEKDGVCILDTPGFSLLDLQPGMEPITLKNYYPEFQAYHNECRFQPCYHFSEPGCAVLEAVKDNVISEKRMARYHQLLEQCKQLWRERYD